MPVLHTSQPQSHIKRFYLPSTRTKVVDGQTVDTPIEEQAWVELDVGPETVADYQAFTDFDQNYAMRQSRIVLRRISAWNFVDEQGNPVPKTFEAFWSLPPEDRLYLITIKFDEPAGSSLTIQEKKT